MTGAILHALRTQVHGRGWTDRHWAGAAGIRHETLSRVLHRGHCDTVTLEALARACGAALRLASADTLESDATGRWPRSLGRESEERILELAARGNLDVPTWRAAGPSFLMAGLALMLSTQDDFDRRGLAALAEELHPGIGGHAAFRRWLRESPLKPSRVLPMIRQQRKFLARGRDDAA